MTVSNAISQFNNVTAKFQTIFSQLEGLFPQLINNDEGTSFSKLRNSISTLSSELSSSRNDSQSFSDKYSGIFNRLNEKISDLKNLDSIIADLKEDSEQMELIALNAMVISVKSGEKGLAFSRITENLQRLSKDMFLYSDELSNEESFLLEQINSLKNIFTGIMDSQQSFSSKDRECLLDFQKLLNNAGPEINSLDNSASKIFPAIHDTKSVLEAKIQIKNKMDSVIKALKILEGCPLPEKGGEKELDYKSFALKIYEKICDLLSQISTSISMCCSGFAGNWAQVLEILESTDNRRMDFESRFLNNHAFGNDNIEKQLSKIIGNYQTIIDDFNNFHTVQANLNSTCESINKRSKSIYSIFENLRPVMSRLHHVRILQQIEVSKNDAIKSVQDSVTDMDNLIISANKSLDQMQGILESFIQDTKNMLDNFIQLIQSDNNEINNLKNEKTIFLSDLRSAQEAAKKAADNFTVYPDDFQKKCVQVQQNLQDLMRFNMDVGTFSNDMEMDRGSHFQERNALLEEKGLTKWELMDHKYLDSIAQI
ncbi:MAG: hypothetical protein K5873_11885 [Treponema sp.]|nr:hypothetical protein [Treponema sp.]